MKNRQNQPTLTKDARALHSNCLCERILARPGFVFCVLLLLLTIVLPPTVTMIQSAPFQRSSSVSNANIKDAPKIRVRGPEDEQAQENTALTSNPSKRLGQRVGIGTAKEATKNDGHCQGKAELLNIVKLANGRPRMPNLETYCSKIPSWEQVSDLYGETPVFVGLETCPRAHTMEFLQSHRSNESIRVAGLYNTGTNLLAQHLLKNFKDAQRPSETSQIDASWYNPTWGKHSVPHQKTEGKVFPIVLVKDPYSWMNSMCRLPYGAHWDRRGDGSCPNLVRSNQTSSSERATYEVVVTRERERGEVLAAYPSLADFWSQWINGYLFRDQPRLIVRYEDLLFHAPTVLNTIANCTGLELVQNPIHYQWGRSKGSSLSSGLIQALQTYGGATASARRGGMSQADVRYATKDNGLDHDLMNLFHYRHP